MAFINIGQDNKVILESSCESKEVKRKLRKEKRKNSKTIAILWSLLYFALVIGLCISGTWIYVKSNYYPIYISGNSMNPTLRGGTKGPHDFGYIDSSSAIIDGINRFDIVTTFFPFAEEDYAQPYVHGSKHNEDASHKIKRVIAVPGDTFTIRNNIIYFLEDEKEVEAQIDFQYNYSTYTPVDFKTNGIGDENGYVTLKEDEYWVMGDNWPDSRDSYASKNESGGGPVYKENIVGVLIVIVGTCEVTSDGKIINKKYETPRFFK